MATTVEIFVGGKPLEQVAAQIEQCTGMAGTVNEYGTIDYVHADFVATLARHGYPEGGDIDVTDYEFELSAKNYWDPESGGKFGSLAVQWFRALFACLRSRNDLRLLLTYNIEQILERFEPPT